MVRALSGARFRLVDSTDPKLRDREGVVEVWEPKSGQSWSGQRADDIDGPSGESVRVWPCEIVTIEEPKGSSADEWKRRNMAGPDAAASTRQDDWKRARLDEGRGSVRGGLPARSSVNARGLVTSSCAHQGGTRNIYEMRW